MTKLDRSTIPDPPNTLRYDGFTFSLTKKIGEGGFARCYEAVEQLSGRKFALKAVHVRAISLLQAKTKLLNEIEIHHRLHHRYIVKLYRIFQDGEFIYLVLELCENRTMVELLRRKRVLSEPETRHYLWMIMCGVEYLHENRVIHRDLKLGNLFLNLENEIKLGDFGLATTVDQVGDRKKTMCGTPNYIAPEVLHGKETGHSYEVDVWAVGVIMYTFLFGRPPFQSSEIPDIYNKIRSLAYTFPEDSRVSEIARDLIRVILTSDPSRRPKLPAIASHVFFRQVVIKDPSLHEMGSIRKYLASTCGDQIGREKKQGVVETVYHRLCEYIDGEGNVRPVTQMGDRQIVAGESNGFHVERWIDYTDKYGLGYLCSNGDTGAYFNDSTTMVYRLATGMLEYLEMPSGGQQVRSSHRMDEHPASLNKKVVIIRHFCSCFSKYARTGEGGVEVEWVTKYARVKNAIAFRLSTRSIQVIFDEDSHSVVLSPSGNLVTVVDQAGNQEHVLHDLFRSASRPEIVSRLGMVKQILGSLLADS